MSIDYPAVLDALQRNADIDLRQQFESLTLAEIVELGTFIGPTRLGRMVALPITMTAFRLPPTPLDTAAVLAELNLQAFGVGPGHLGPLQPDKTITDGVRTALLDVANRRRAAPLLTMREDVTNTLPRQNATPPALSDADYQAAATRQNVEVAAIKAVAIVESGGRTGFDTRGRPKILFEAHHFSGYTANRFNLTHPHLSVPSALWRNASAFYPWDQYQRLHEAMLLDIDAALKSASWGKFQVLGSNHNGWNDVRSFVAAMYVSEANHLRSFEAYCNDNGLMAAVRSRDWLSFARGYNGKRQRGYDARMADAYSRAGGTSPPARPH
jgi:hypothetical protein